MTWEWAGPGGERVPGGRPGGSRWSALGNTLTIAAVNRTDAGQWEVRRNKLMRDLRTSHIVSITITWQVRASNSVGATRLGVVLTVRYPPTITTISPTTVIQPHSPLNLICR